MLCYTLESAYSAEESFSLVLGFVGSLTNNRRRTFSQPDSQPYLILIVRTIRHASVMLSCRLVLQARVIAPRAVIARRAIPASSALRQYAQAAPASRQQSAKPPIALFGLDGTYASALVCSKNPIYAVGLKLMQQRPAYANSRRRLTCDVYSIPLQRRLQLWTL